MLDGGGSCGGDICVCVYVGGEGEANGFVLLPCA